MLLASQDPFVPCSNCQKGPRLSFCQVRFSNVAWVCWVFMLEPQESNSIAVRKSAYNIRLYALYNSLESGRNTFTHHPLLPSPQTPNSPVYIPVVRALIRCSNAMSFQGPTYTQLQYNGVSGIHVEQICHGMGHFIQRDTHVLGGHNVLIPMPIWSRLIHDDGYQNDRICAKP